MTAVDASSAPVSHVGDMVREVKREIESRHPHAIVLLADQRRDGQPAVASIDGLLGEIRAYVDDPAILRVVFLLSEVSIVGAPVDLETAALSGAALSVFRAMAADTPVPGRTVTAVVHQSLRLTHKWLNRERTNHASHRDELVAAIESLVDPRAGYMHGACLRLDGVALML